MNIRHLAARAAWILLAVVMIASCAKPAPTDIITSPNDDRDYRHLVLENGLSVILISDPTTDEAAASLSVFRGNYEDPANRLGLAHFLEHMLFLGTAKYPEVDGYQSYISTHAGSHNAYTGTDHTNFFFDIDPDYLEGALDRFAQFFIAPTFDAAYVDREKNAVNSEYQLQLKDDGWRGFMVAKQTFNPDHPGSQFNIGSLETLAGDVRADLLAWFAKNYSADQMGLVVLGNQSLDTLEGWVSMMFTPIPNRHIGPSGTPGPLFAKDYLPRQLSYRTIKNQRSVTYNFPTPGVDSVFRENPMGYISNLLGHEGAGSLHAELKERGWIHGLSASGGRYDRDNGLVSVDIELTELGAAHVDEITGALFRDIELIRKGVERWRYEEQSRLAELAFRFQDKAQPLAYVRSISPNMDLYPIEDILIAPYLMERFDPELIEGYLSYLRPDNVLIELAGPDVATDQVEPWFDVPYQISPARMVALGTSDMSLVLPEPNPFIPERLGLVEAADSTPIPALERPGITIWAAPDTSFGVPRAVLQVRLAVPGGLTTPRDAAYSALYARLVQDRLNQLSYPALIAGLGYQISTDSVGFQITVSGYNDKLPLLFDDVLEAFATLEPTGDRVALYRDQLYKDWNNFVNERPYAQAYASLSYLLLEGRWAPSRLAQAVADAELETVNEWADEHLDQFNVLALITGNVTPDAAAKLGRRLESVLPLRPFEPLEPLVVRLDDQRQSYPLSIDHDDAAMVMYLQGRSDSFAERALFGLSAQLLQAPYFTDLRTEQQLGYVVAAGTVLLRRTPGLFFAVQSPVAGPDQLVDATEAFLGAFEETLHSMPAETFEANKQGLVTRLLENDKNLGERSERYWSDLELGFTDFDSRAQIADAVAAIDKAGYEAFFDTLRAEAENNRLVIYSPGRFGAAPDGALFGGAEAQTTEAAAGGPAQPSSRRNGGSASSSAAP